MKRYIKNRISINAILVFFIVLEAYAKNNIDLLISILGTYNITCYLIDNFTIKIK